MITYKEVLEYVRHRVATAEDSEDWEDEVKSFCDNLCDDLIQLGPAA
jgi:hypothetical protein